MPINALPLGLLIFAFLSTAAVIIPFINLLYRLKFQRAKQKTLDAFGKPTPIFDKFNKFKAGTPVGGGILIILAVCIMFLFVFPLLRITGIKITNNYAQISDEILVIFFTFISFGLLGLYDDVKKFFDFEKTGFFGLKMGHKLFLQIFLAAVIASWLYFKMGIEILNIPFLGTYNLGLLFIPFIMFVIVAFTNAVNITDGMDGLAGGILLFSLIGLWLISMTIVDTPLSIFIGLWIGALVAFLYFNVYPARIFMGDSGALAFGATFAVIGILLGKTIALVIIGLIFVVEITSSLIQLLSKRFRKKKVFPVAPFHLFLRYFGWEEPKIVQRLWLAQIILTCFGIWLTLI